VRRTAGPRLRAKAGWQARGDGGPGCDGGRTCREKKGICKTASSGPCRRQWHREEGGGHQPFGNQKCVNGPALHHA